jgi:prevent-host-death family protein
MSALTYRNREGELVDVPSVAATTFKNQFGAILEQAALTGAVAVTKHDTTKVVVLSLAEFEALASSREASLEALTGEFDSLLERMQKPKSKAAMAAVFQATPEQLGLAAVKAAKAEHIR